MRRYLNQLSQPLQTKEQYEDAVANQQACIRDNCGFLKSLLGGCVSFGAGNYYPEIQPDKDGWYTWIDKHPPDKLIQYKHESWDTAIVGYAKDLYPEANISGLKWRLTGIGKETQ